ncbi:MAG: hypothetical protein MO853_01890 [Candidatus Protistobacter heckmanni]|nr:hypothetical protein [Candidatus Protistobacter heckmanni]
MHDLRSPLAVIDGYGRAIEQRYGDKMDAETRSHLVRIRSKTVEMEQMIEHLLPLARVMRTPIAY